MKFEEINLNDNLKRALKELEYDELTEIQEKTFDPVLRRKDVIAMSNTGSGKTAAFLLPLIQKIYYEDKRTQILIVTPTRELAIQIVQEARKFCKYEHSINCMAVYGGQDVKMQAISLRKGVKIVVGTPGRIVDMLKKKTLKLSGLRALVLDEADEMLSMGFEEDINKIFEHVSYDAQKLLFSATINERVKDIAKKRLKSPLYFECMTNESKLVDNIKQVAIDVKEKMKNECTLRILKNEHATNSIVFCNTKKKTEEVADYLSQNNIKLEVLNSDIRQEEREKVLKRLKQGELDTIVVTDVLARGIDVEDLELVINYDIPFENEYYVHRIGRTARKGKSGIAYILYTGKQIDRIKEIEEYTNRKFEYQDVPVSKQEKNNIDFPLVNDNYYLVTLSLGKNDQIKAKDIVGALGALVGLKSDKIGKIEVKEVESTVEIPKEYINDVVEKFTNGIIKGKSVNIVH